MQSPMQQLSKHSYRNASLNWIDMTIVFYINVFNLYVNFVVIKIQCQQIFMSQTCFLIECFVCLLLDGIECIGVHSKWYIFCTVHLACMCPIYKSLFLIHHVIGISFIISTSKIHHRMYFQMLLEVNIHVYIFVNQIVTLG